MPTLLHFEDDPLYIETLKPALERSGFTYKHHLSPAPDPIAVVVREKPDIIITDITMPGMNGFLATKVLRANDLTRHIPIIALTNLGAVEQREKGMALGMSAYLVKYETSPDDVIMTLQAL